LVARPKPAAGNSVLATDTKEKESHDMFKIAAIIGGVLLLAGVALAGTVTSLGTTTTPSISSLPAASTTAAVTTAGQDDRGRENEARGRANQPGEDLRGPCDEAEHANDPRCVGATAAGTATVTARDDDDRGEHHQRGHDDDRGDDHGGNSGRGGGGESGHGGHGGDD
jgi:uncharacterized membrane protein YgcG